MTGIYGIYTNDDNGNDKLLYVGMTMVGFLNRFSWHQECVTDVGQLSKLYEAIHQLLDEGNDVYMKPILNLDDLSLSYHHVLTSRDVECMELAFISSLKPELNIQGTVTNYSFEERPECFVCSRYSQGYEKRVLNSQWCYYFTLDGHADKRNKYEDFII